MYLDLLRFAQTRDTLSYERKKEKKKERMKNSIEHTIEGLTAHSCFDFVLTLFWFYFRYAERSQAGCLRR